MWVMAEGEPRNPIADELLSRVAIDTPASRQAVAGGAGMFLIDPDRAQQLISDIRSAALTLTDARWILTGAQWTYTPNSDRVSANFADQAATMSNRAIEAADHHHQALVEVAHELQRQFDDYQEVELANTPGVRP
jgi:hypothetical protein